MVHKFGCNNVGVGVIWYITVSLYHYVASLQDGISYAGKTPFFIWMGALLYYKIFLRYFLLFGIQP